MPGNVVRNINEMNRGVYGQDDPLHNADVLILKAKIGEQGYDGDAFLHVLISRYWMLDAGFNMGHPVSSIQHLKVLLGRQELGK